MQVFNTSSQIRVFGNCRIPPRSIGTLPEEFIGRPEVQMLVKAGKLTLIDQVPVPAKPEPKVEKKPEPPKVESKPEPKPEPPKAEPPKVESKPESGFSIEEPSEKAPPNFADLHAGKAKAWAARCKDVELLKAMSKVETRAKVKSAMDIRIAVLEARD